jgi:hypothetical protein
VLLRVRAETCGPCPPHHQAFSVPGSLSSGHFSQRVSRPETCQSPQGLQTRGRKINKLRVDESSGFISTLVPSGEPLMKDDHHSLLNLCKNKLLVFLNSLAWTNEKFNIQISYMFDLDVFLLDGLRRHVAFRFENHW